MVAEQEPIHVVLFPLMAHGHMIPLLDVARLLAARGAKATLITTPANAPVFAKSPEIALQVIPFPSEEVGLPAGVENLEHLSGAEMLEMFLEAIALLKTPVEAVLERLRPRCLVSDLLLPWTADVAGRLGIPRLTFHGSSYFVMSVSDALRKHRPFAAVESESESEEFVVPEVPGEVRMTRRKLSPHWEEDPLSGVAKLLGAVVEVEEKSFGVIMNSFEELEPDYAQHCRKVMGKRAWSIGPVSLCNRNMEDKASRGKKAGIEQQECLKWLDSKPPNSVIYICFGSITNMSTAQLKEIAVALESCAQHFFFMWAVPTPSGSNANTNTNLHKDVKEEWLPSGFEERTRYRGLLIRGWAPQLMILDHVATGAFLTHCGWNSTLEAISLGVNMVTSWPLFADQFLNEKLIVDVLRVGVSVGANQYLHQVVEAATVGSQAVEEALRRAMVGDQAQDMRRRAAALKDMASKAVEQGGSSYQGLNHLFNQLRSFHANDDPLLIN